MLPSSGPKRVWRLLAPCVLPLAHPKGALRHISASRELTEELVNLREQRAEQLREQAAELFLLAVEIYCQKVRGVK